MVGGTNFDYSPVISYELCFDKPEMHNFMKPPTGQAEIR